MIKNYFKTTLRNLVRNKVYTAINIVGLSLGLACAMLIILYVKDEVSYDGFHKNINNIYRVDRNITRQDGRVDKSGYTGYFQGPRFTTAIPEVQTFVRLQPTLVDIKVGTDIQSQPIYLVDSNFFIAFSFPLLQGNPKTVLLQPNSVVISEEMAKKQFGTADALGRIMLLKESDRFVPYLVTGVARNCPRNSSIKFQVVLPLKVSADDESRNENWFNSFLSTFVVLTPNAGVKATEAKMQQVFQADASESIKMIREKYGLKNLGLSFFLQSFSSIHLSRDVPAEDQGFSDVSNPVFSYLLSGIAVFILLIACINFINLTVARSLKRAREIGIRKVIGGNRKQLMLQFLGESFMLCFIAFVVAVLVVQFVLPVFNTLSNKALALSYLFDAKLIAGYIALFITTSLLAGFYPALVLSNYNPVQTLYSRFTLAGNNYLQKSLVVLQFALASFLIIATLTIFSQFKYLTTQKLGYDNSNLLTVQKWSMPHAEAQLFREELLKSPYIAGVGLKNNGSSGTTVKVNNATQVNITYETVDASFIPLLKIPVVAGRNFSAGFPSDSAHSVLVNEAFVREAGWKDPIGQEVDFFDGNEKYSVVGVVKDYHFKAVTEKIEPQLFTMRPANEYGMAYIKIKPGNATASLRYIEKVFKKLFPLTSYSYSFSEQENLKNYESEAKWKQIIFFAAILTIFISCIGLFGLSVLAAEKRTKEIGIRKVLGASVGSVATIMSKDFLKLVVIALLVAMPLAWLAAVKWLQNYPYRISLNWGMFALTGILVIFIALTTVSFQAIKAAISNPVKSLRSE
ncbi:MAG: ABC transporter permease [Ginsengibacter sp.]